MPSGWLYRSDPYCNVRLYTTKHLTMSRSIFVGSWLHATLFIRSVDNMT
jgi:hypothetical protein